MVCEFTLVCVVDIYNCMRPGVLPNDFEPTQANSLVNRPNKFIVIRVGSRERAHFKRVFEKARIFCTHRYRYTYVVETLD